MMNSPRKRPDFDSEDIYFLIRQGLLGIVLSTIAVLFGLMLLYAGFSSKRILNSLFGLVFTPIAVLQLWMCIKEILMYSTASIFPTPQWIEPHDAGSAAPEKGRQITCLLHDLQAAQWIAAHKIILKEGIHRPGGYLLDVRPEGILLAGHDAAGCFYAGQSLRQLAEAGEIPMVTVQDWPYKPLRGVHLYMPGRKNIPFFKNLLHWLASLKYNTLFLEVGGGMRYHRHPEINTAWEKFCQEAEAYSGGPEALQEGATRYLKNSLHTELGGGSCLEQAEVQELLDFAHALHIEVIPELQSLSHSYYLCCAHPEIAELPDDPWPDTFCPSNSRSYEIYFDLLEEALAVFQPRIVHIGHDEVYNLGVCPRCRGKSGNDLLAGDLLKIHAFLKERGVRMALWGDTLLPFSFNMWEGGVARHVERHSGACADIPETFRAIEKLPRDVLISEWQGNTNPMAMQFFIQAGFEVYCGNFGDNFAAHAYPRWNERSVSAQVLGGEPSTWCNVSEFAFAYNGCLFNMAFSAELLWWSHYRDAERGRLTAQIAALMPQARQALAGKEGEACPSNHELRSLNALPHLAPIPFAPHLSGQLLNIGHPSASIPVSRKAAWLGFTHLCQTRQSRRATWELTNLYQHPAENLLAVYTVQYPDGRHLDIPVHYGTHVACWDVPYGEHVDAIPYQADPARLGTALTGQGITAYRFTWFNPHPEKEILSLELTYLGMKEATLWLLDIAATEP